MKEQINTINKAICDINCVSGIIVPTRGTLQNAQCSILVLFLIFVSLALLAGLLETEIVDLVALSFATSSGSVSEPNLAAANNKNLINVQQVYHEASAASSRGIGAVTRLLREVKHWLGSSKGHHTAGSTASGPCVFALTDASLRTIVRARYFSAKGCEKTEMLARICLAGDGTPSSISLSNGAKPFIHYCDILSR